jgi:hypothetical protein
MGRNALLESRHHVELNPASIFVYTRCQQANYAQAPLPDITGRAGLQFWNVNPESMPKRPPQNRHPQRPMMHGDRISNTKTHMAVFDCLTTIGR